MNETEISALAIALWGELNPGKLEKYTKELRDILWALEFLGYDVIKRPADPVATVEKVMVRKPQVGDIVHYIAPRGISEPLHVAAIITSLVRGQVAEVAFEDGSYVELTTFEPMEVKLTVASALSDQECTPGSWHFPEMCKPCKWPL